MNTSLGRNGLIGLAVGASAGLGLIACIIYREIRRRKSQWMILEARPAPRLFEAADGAAPVRETQDAQGGFIICLAPLAQLESSFSVVMSDKLPLPPVSEAQRQALAAVEAVVQCMSPDQQLELRNQLDQVLSCVASLRSEVAELRDGLQEIALQIIPDVK